MTPEIIQGLLDRAMDNELGVVIETNNTDEAFNKISVHRKDLDRKYECLIIARSSVPNQIIIYKKTVNLDGEI